MPKVLTFAVFGGYYKIRLTVNLKASLLLGKLSKLF